MHLVVDAAGQQVEPFPVYFFHRGRNGNMASDLFYTPVFDQQIAVETAAFVNDGNILYQVILHNLARNCKQFTWCNLLKPLQGM
jgi:hypothetical protein